MNDLKLFKGILIGLIIIIISFLLFFVSSCQTTDAETYKNLYAMEVTTNDTLRSELKYLSIQLQQCNFNFDTLQTYIQFKIDSIKNNCPTFFWQAETGSVDTLLNNIEYGLEHLNQKQVSFLLNLQKQ